MKNLNFRTSRKGLQMAAASLCFLSVGIAIGISLPKSFLPTWLAFSAAATEPTEPGSADEPHLHVDDHVHAEPDDEEESAIFDVTEAAAKTIKLQVGTPRLGSYSELISLPAFVRERPAVSNLYASSKLAGIVTKIHVSIGQSVREGDPLIDLELTGESLAETQSTLLDSTKQLEIVQKEIARIRPVAEAGGVARKNLLAKEYEEKRLLAVIDTKKQELLLRGFSAEQLKLIVENGQLVRQHTIRVPRGIQPDGPVSPRAKERLLGVVGQPDTAVPVSSSSSDPWVYSIEKLSVNPGSMIEPGQPLCDLSFHASLLLEGQAYERDLPSLTRLFQSGSGVSIKMGSDDSPEFYDNVPILYIDNHIEPETQSVRVYLELQNLVTSETFDANGAMFRSWKYRPSQRGHVLLPEREWTDKFILPADAVVRDGVDRVVFKEVGFHRPEDEAAHHEFVKVPVTELYSDRRAVVVDVVGDLKKTDRIALNQGYLLLLQMNQAAGGGGHAHSHEH